MIQLYLPYFFFFQFIIHYHIIQHYMFTVTVGIGKQTTNKHINKHIAINKYYIIYFKATLSEEFPESICEK